VFKRAREGTKRSWIKASSGALLAALVFTLSPTPVYAAITNPNVMEFESIWVTHNLYEDGDILLTFQYSISWINPENQPEEPANKTFLFRLMDEVMPFGGGI